MGFRCKKQLSREWREPSFCICLWRGGSTKRVTEKRLGVNEKKIDATGISLALWAHEQVMGSSAFFLLTSLSLSVQAGDRQVSLSGRWPGTGPWLEIYYV